ncbi:MAG TPA: hypothetical protein VGR35_15265 [Tepidisphaeraceae bacterium]|nr:hypothetical protein [Tepidisphaeraceae bacterium]
MKHTIAFIIFVAWSSFVLTTANHYGRVTHRVHRISRIVGIIGVALEIPVLLIAGYGLPTGFSFRWIGIVVNIGYVGLGLAIAGACAWLIADSVFVWQQRRRVFPFAFRRPPGGEG